MALRTDYTNDTPSTNEHPASHNDVNVAVNALQSRAGSRRGPAGHWIWAFDYNVAPGTGALAGRHLRMTRFAMDQSFDGAVFEITTAVASATAKVAIYRTRDDGMPTSLAHGSASVDVSTTGMKPVTFAALPAGVYWIGIIPTVDGLSARSMINPNSGFITAGPTMPGRLQDGLNAWQHFLGSFAADGVLPDPWGPPYPRDANTGNTDQVQAFMLRLA